MPKWPLEDKLVERNNSLSPLPKDSAHLRMVLTIMLLVSCDSSGFVSVSCFEDEDTYCFMVVGVQFYLSSAW